MLKKFLKPITLPVSADWGVLILRVGVSLIMMTHGYPKLNKLISGDYAFADPLGMGQELSLILTVGAEFFCSLLLLLGIATRAVLIPLIFTMAVVFFIVHGNDPFGDKESAMMFLISYLTLFFTGPGRFSLDKKLF